MSSVISCDTKQVRWRIRMTVGVEVWYWHPHRQEWSVMVPPGTNALDMIEARKAEILARRLGFKEPVRLEQTVIELFSMPVSMAVLGEYEPQR